MTTKKVRVDLEVGPTNVTVRFTIEGTDYVMTASFGSMRELLSRVADVVETTAMRPKLGEKGGENEQD